MSKVNNPSHYKISHAEVRPLSSKHLDKESILEAERLEFIKNPDHYYLELAEKKKAEDAKKKKALELAEKKKAEYETHVKFIDLAKQMDEGGSSLMRVPE